MTGFNAAVLPLATFRLFLPTLLPVSATGYGRLLSKHTSRSTAMVWRRLCLPLHCPITKARGCIYNTLMPHPVS
jgi:hypothetical protein